MGVVRRGGLSCFEKRLLDPTRLAQRSEGSESGAGSTSIPMVESGTLIYTVGYRGYTPRSLHSE